MAAIGRRELDDLHQALSKHPDLANRLSKMFSLARAWGWRPDNPVKGIGRFAEGRRDRWLGTDELSALSKAIRAYPDRRILPRVPLRPGELRTPGLKGHKEPAMQAYSPFRTVLLERAELSRLSSLRPAIPVRDTLLHWIVILAAWTVVALRPSPLMVAIAVLIIGTNFYGLYIIGHDGLHRRLFDEVRANDLWNDILIVGSFGAITRLNRRNHMDHHQDTCLAQDPDRHKYCHAGKEAVVPFVAFLSGLANLWQSVRNVFLGRRAARTRESYSARDFLILAAWQALLLAGLTWAIGRWAYPLLWLFPVYFFGYRADLTRVFCEHVVRCADKEADKSLRLITYRSNWLEKRFFAPHNMNFHAAHHLWIGNPYYNLPEADRLMRARAGDDPRLEVRNSYAGYLLHYLRWRMREAGLPATTQA